MNSSACRRKEQSWLALTFLNSPGKKLLHPTVRLGPDGPALPGWTLSLSAISRYVVTRPPDPPGCLSEPSARPSSTCASCSRIWFGVGSCCCEDTRCMLLNESSAPKARAIKIDVLTRNRRNVLPPLHWQICLSSSASRSHPFLHNDTYGHQRNRGYQSHLYLKATRSSCTKTFSGGAYLFGYDYVDSYRWGGGLAPQQRETGRRPVSHSNQRQMRFLHALPASTVPGPSALRRACRPPSMLR